MASILTNALASKSGYLVMSSLLLLSGCSGVSGEEWHSKYGWKSEDYFTDPQVISLCKAIEANDLTEIDRLIKAGADVNAKGKGNMTPLLWAFPDNKLERFKKLLEHGADPNVVVESKFNTPLAIHPGHSVTHLAAAAAEPEYFQLVMEHGGDPNLSDKNNGNTLLHVVVTSAAMNKKERIQVLIDSMESLDRSNSSGVTATTLAVGWGGQYDIALMLLNAGANPRAHGERTIKRLVHAVEREQRAARNRTAQATADLQAIVEILEDHDESLEVARKDSERWMEWGKVYPAWKYRELFDKEIADFIEREKSEANQKNDEDPP